MRINDPFPGDWYASADRPSAPCARRMIEEAREREHDQRERFGLCADHGLKCCDKTIPTEGK